MLTGFGFGRIALAAFDAVYDSLFPRRWTPFVIELLL
jgi:hypothetical protein